ncbi:MAG: hypothetical protein HC904_06915 [Blastochloris sp.]|nr:hypothetical protein [Blastochloris sp.]
MPRLLELCFWKMFLFLYARVLRLFFQLKVSGSTHIPPDQPCVFVTNHGSHYDAFLCM